MCCASLAIPSATRRAVKKLDAEIVFEVRDGAAHRRLTKAESLGRRGEARGLDDANEDGDSIQIHAGPSRIVALDATNGCICRI